MRTMRVLVTKRAPWPTFALGVDCDELVFADQVRFLRSHEDGCLTMADQLAAAILGHVI